MRPQTLEQECATVRRIFQRQWSVADADPRLHAALIELEAALHATIARRDSIEAFTALRRAKHGLERSGY